MRIRFLHYQNTSMDVLMDVVMGFAEGIPDLGGKLLDLEGKLLDLERKLFDLQGKLVEILRELHFRSLFLKENY